MTDENKKNDQSAAREAPLSAPAGSVPPTAEELYKALDDLHIACECAIVPDVEEWYRGDPFASEARQNAIDVLLRYHHSQNAPMSKAQHRDVIGLPPTPGSEPTWEHGYRCHGYWRGTERVGSVGLGPRKWWDGKYRCSVYLPKKEVTATRRTLKAAKRWVEKTYSQNAQGEARR